MKWLDKMIKKDTYTVIRAKTTRSGPADTYNRVVAKNAQGEHIYFHTEEDLQPGDVVRERKK